MKIPTIGPEHVRQVTSESSEREVEPSRIQGVGDSIATIAGQAQDSAMLLYKAGKARDNLRAENVADVAQSKLMADLDNEKDFTPEKTAKYKERAQKHDLDSANLISNPVDRQNFLLQRESKRNIQNIQIEHLQEARMVKDYKAQMDLKAATGGTAYVQTDFSTTGNLVRQSQVAELKKMLDKGLETGVYDTKAERDLAQRTILDRWHKAKVDYDINKDAAATGKRLNAGVYNSILTDEQILVAKEDVQKQIKANATLEKAKNLRAKQEQVKQENATIMKLGTLAMANDPTYRDQVDALVREGKINTDTGFNLKLVAESPDEWKKTLEDNKDDKGNLPAAGAGVQPLIDAVKGLQGNPEEQNKLLVTALRNVNDPKSGFSKTDLIFFLRAAAGKDADPANPIWSWLSSAGNAISNVQTLGLQGLIKDRFTAAWDFKSDPRPLADQIVQDTYQQNTPVAANLVVGKTYKQGKFVGYNPKTGALQFDK